jgi:23S rRNA (uracil1939-C5)-methyltransferase
MQVVPEISGVCANLNTHKGNRIFGEQTVCLAGESQIVERLASSRGDRPEKLRQGIEFKLSATSFFQINSRQAVELLELVFDRVAEIGRPISLIADAYAGVGTMSFWLAPLADKVLAVEDYPAAVADGRLNAGLNEIGNVEFQCGSVETVLKDWVEQDIRPEVLVLDPPRKGVSAEAMEQVLHLQAPRVIYVSCNPATLARDLKILQRNGYKTREIQPLDMFPQTYHVESVTLLEYVGV